ncbi:hypothetical protein [Nocardioides yefusunii]|uniref:Uncharacterized protein n=1 Tax=Nocardioides yefusunii TaxID=2500546 RepID=A0ABW1QVP0_9ACTN|nr:hypothetical protein [Nocardioides yefusunii]
MRFSMRTNTGEWQQEATSLADDPVGFAVGRGARLLSGDVVIGSLYLDAQRPDAGSSRRWPWRSRRAAHVILWIEIAGHQQSIWLSRAEAAALMAPWGQTLCTVGALAFTCHWMDASESDDLRRTLGITADIDVPSHLSTT